MSLLKRVGLIIIGIMLVTPVVCPRICLGEEADEDGDVLVPWDSHPVWSPDGTKVAFVSTRSATGGDPGEDNIWIINADGTGRRQLTTDGGNTNPTWSPDGVRIAFTAGAQIHCVTVETGSLTEFTKGDRGGFDPDWHPSDAKKIICWFKTFRGDNDIVIIDTDKCLTDISGRKPLKIRQGDDTNPRWSRDGTKLAFIGQTKDPVTNEITSHLMTVNADGSDLQEHCTARSWAGSISWYPAGDKVVVDGGSVCDLTTGESSSLFGVAGVSEPDVSPNGQYVVYAEYVEGVGQMLFVSNIDGTNKRQLTFP